MKNISKVFLDANILFDLCLTDRPFYKYSERAIGYLLEHGGTLYTSSDFVTTVYYVFSKIIKNRNLALELLESIISYTTLVPFSNKEVEMAFRLMAENRKFRDLEDTLVYVLAKRINCDLILSNDGSFYSPDLSVMDSKKFCEIYCN